jgi:hypothetical protein
MKTELQRKFEKRYENFAQEKEIGPGDFFEVGTGHDAWVVGNEMCVALDFAV